MNLRALTLKYMGWCPGVKSAARFIPDRNKEEEESWERIFTKRNLTLLLGIIGLFSIVIINGNGIPVPIKEPFVKLEILVEKETYRIGEDVQAQFLLRNMMPFSIRIKFKSDVIKRGYYIDTQEGFTSQEVRLRKQTEGIKLSIGSAIYEDEAISFIPSRSGDYIFYFKVEETELMRTVKIED
jgi:hypothetical protein